MARPQGVDGHSDRVVVGGQGEGRVRDEGDDALVVIVKVNHHCLLLCSRVPSPEKCTFKATGSRDRFQQFDKKLTNLGLMNVDCRFLNLSESPPVLYKKI